MLGLENGLYGTLKANLALTQNKDRITLHLCSTLVFFSKIVYICLGQHGIVANNTPTMDGFEI